MVSPSTKKSVSLYVNMSLPYSLPRKKATSTRSYQENLNQKVSCLLSIKENHWLQHKKHTCKLEANLQTSENNLVKDLPSMSYKDDLLCETCQKVKQIKNSFSSKNIVSTSTPLQLLHLDLFGPTRTMSISGKRYRLTQWTTTLDGHGPCS